MRRMFLCAVGFVGLVVGSSPAAQPAGTPEIRGTWIVVDAEMSGKKVKSTTTWEFQGNKMTRKTSTTAKGTVFQIVCDPTKNPKEIDLISTAGKVQKGIYQINGDELKICYNAAVGAAIKKPRPSAFQTQANDGYYLYTLKLQK